MTSQETPHFQPKIDLHRHLLGSIQEELITSRLKKYQHEDLSSRLSPPQKAFLKRSGFGRSLLELLQNRELEPCPKALQNFSSLPEFLACYVATSTLISDAEDLKELVHGAIRGAVSEGITHLELTISPTLYLSKAIPWEEFISILQSAKSDYCASPHFALHWLLDPIRDRGPEHASAFLLSFLQEAPGLLTGASLAGDERSFDILVFQEYFQLAKAHGLGTTAHIGEHPSSRELGAALTLPLDRIGHGISAAFDEEGRRLLKKKNTPLEICISSNLQTGQCKSLPDHPLRQLFEADIPVTINTDDPFFFQTSLQKEFRLAEELLGSSAIPTLMKNAEQARFG